MTLHQKAWAVGLLLCAVLLLLPHGAAACSETEFLYACDTAVMDEAENCWEYCIWIRECEGYEVDGGVCDYNANGCFTYYGGYECKCILCYI